MTMSGGLMEWLEGRALDIEALSAKGWDGQQKGGGEILVMPFIREGQVVRRKYRPLDYNGEGPRFWQDKGGLKVAYNEDCLRDPALKGKPLIITEGEIDAESAILCGFPKTISVPDGAPPPNPEKDQDQDARKYSWLEDIAPLLSRQDCPEIILASDGDPNGAQLLHDLSHRLGRFRCKFVTYPKTPKLAMNAIGRERLKDLNEALVYYGPNAVAATIAGAQYVKAPGVHTLSSLPPKNESRLFEIGFDTYGEHCKLRKGDLSVWTGVPSSGKSTAIQDIVCRVVERYGIVAAWGSFEQDPQTDHKRNFTRWFNRQLVGKQTFAQIKAAEDWIERHHIFIVADEDDDTTLDWLLDAIETAALRYNAEIIVIDPWNELDHTRERHETLTEYVGRAIKTLKKCAKRLDVHIAIVAHPSKQQKLNDGTFAVPSLYDISDSAHFFNKCDLGVVIHRTSPDRVMFKTAKSKYHDIIGTPGAVAMEFCKEDGRFREWERL